MCCSLLIKFNSVLKKDELPGPEAALSSPEKESAEAFCCSVSFDISLLWLDLIILFQLQCPSVLGHCNLLFPRRPGRWWSGGWCSPCHLRCVLRGQWWDKWDSLSGEKHPIYHFLLQDLVSSLMMLSSSDDDDGKINQMNNLFWRNGLFMNRAILSELRTILFWCFVLTTLFTASWRQSAVLVYRSVVLQRSSRSISECRPLNFSDLLSSIPLLGLSSGLS